ncbi:hypothetical protein [Saccharolobus islandicus]|uniref:hypothetical protein n=1 Tax=Saccharolobus islandicus TaxID=43080 RepID=UPI000AACBA78|nr:hypothetical protein [Sulfolobus islandicus]
MCPYIFFVAIIPCFLCIVLSVSASRIIWLQPPMRGIKIREGKASALRGVVIEVFFLNLYRNLEVLLTRIRTRVLVN